ncbi:uncharacterized protein CTRU02_201493 [Colletotrichum truncatum]|uniref:Uncharacterized protein n=1 Tax=Colletotrichum truncatum TaxID=5467 RepID=A0ACC3ZHM3_COLTU|nr:uncharacterized protein CTRU02_14362 [Colletotrichum truncatum]KAF6782324.1 hypothetical protein CTRU02_14362 [Colletotrichum truncatum]
MASASPFPVIVHQIPSDTPNLVAYERGHSSAKNALVFIGGLTEGPHTNAAIGVIADKLEGSGFGVWELRMRSSFTGFGFSKLSNDVEDISALVDYLRKLHKEKIVLFGTSTGCQDCLEYTNRDRYKSVPVDGYVLLNPVSDRQAAGLLMSQDDYEKSIKHAQGMISESKQNEAMPMSLIPFIFTSPITAYRWNSLGAKGGDDDYFSSDLDDATIRTKFGGVDKPILLLPGENDELVLPSVDKKELLRRWAQACPEGTLSELSGHVPGADHTLSQPEAREWVAKTVGQFLKGV